MTLISLGPRSNSHIKTESLLNKQSVENRPPPFIEKESPSAACMLIATSSIQG